ncbi:polysaccharide biosynthesis/export family protein [Vibrio genomosp. F10]|uniref:polysaccharide biosynthesis/export family protein n=1 Tax=Vibrio genomosp. F10 TaxID=723171 RepID=UPI0002E927CD|nr:polysaccharide biosynthesis/export family protein [Vibrio genomosp. F10]OEE96207.1 capsular biosynthesis protein [Vibrio genomosp. F10 str. 9ZD137]
MTLRNFFIFLAANCLICSPLLADETNYRLGAGDRIQIHVYGEPELSFNQLFISSNGLFDYPYLGQIKALNKTTQQLKDQISSGLRGDYLIEPKVMVTVLSFRKIYINGEVKNPGGYEYQPGLTVDKAIALAGGFTERASKRNITVTNDASGSLSSKITLDQNVRPGDIITIEESFF